MQLCVYKKSLKVDERVDCNDRQHHKARSWSCCIPNEPDGVTFFRVRFLRNKVPFMKWAKCMLTPSPELSELIWSWRSPSYPCEIMYHARKAAAARSISTLTNRGEGGRRYLTNAFPSGTLFRRNRNKKNCGFYHTHNSGRENYEWN